MISSERLIGVCLIDSDNRSHSFLSLTPSLSVSTFPLVSMVTGVGAMTWSPLACGIITGKYQNGIPETSRASMKVNSVSTQQALMVSSTGIEQPSTTP